MAGERHRATAAALAGLAALLLAAPPPPEALRTLADIGSDPDPTGPLVAAVALLAWVLVAWLSLTVAVVLLSRLPGLLGRLGRALAGRVAPAAARRAVEAALGLTVAVGALAPAAALAAPPADPPAAVVDVGTATAWDLDWPGTQAPATDVDRSRPVAPSPVAPSPAATPPTATPPRPSQPAAPAAGALVVRAGDSLWSIAEASLRSAGTAPSDRSVAQAWPRWWAANRDAIGDDPDLLLPGTVLRPPAAGPGAT